MNLDDAAGGDFEPQGYCFESELTQASVSQPHCTPPNAGERVTIKSPYDQLSS